ncbi:MAG: T9SS type A sorting domain-containing protein [Bacteroidetes bacterium]|nr:T9SS type A sorting domain-containing protein [Bacteroidota bacterium]
MMKKLLNFSVCCITSTLMFSQNLNAQCAAVALPYTENFSSVSLGTACSWTASSVASGAGWSIDATAYAGGTSPEVQAYGNNACAGCVETVSLTMASPLNTTLVTSLQLSFKHKLYVTNQATSGPGSGTLRLQSSSDGISWTDRWTYAYTISGSALTSIASGSITAPAFTPTGNNTYIRFAITGVMFKVWGWQLDDVSAIPLITTGLTLEKKEKAIDMLYPNPTQDILNLKLNDSKDITIRISDLLGKQVVDCSSFEGSGETQSINVQHLKKGIYFLSIYKEGQWLETKKVIKE